MSIILSFYWLAAYLINNFMGTNSNASCGFIFIFIFVSSIIPLVKALSYINICLMEKYGHNKIDVKYKNKK